MSEAEQVLQECGGTLQQLNDAPPENRQWVLGRLLEQYIRKTYPSSTVAALVEPDRWLVVGQVQNKSFLYVLQNGETQFDLDALQKTIDEFNEKLKGEG